MAAPEADIGQLSESQQLALQQYTAVTDQDVNAAIPLLQRSQWNVQVRQSPMSPGYHVC
jgi:FAS-associated factor 2